MVHMGSEDEAIGVVQDLLIRAEKVGASDVHIQMLEDVAQVSFRLDGLMSPVETLPSRVSDRVFGRIKYLAKLKTYQDAMPQDGRIEKADIGTVNDIRISTYPTVTGEKVVLRFFPEDIQSMESLAFPAEARHSLEEFLTLKSGLLLLTGPAGSGKTTTIYAGLRHLVEQGGKHIITVEDPVEQVVRGVMQTEINEARGLTFAKAARHLMRQDPQVLVIGEVRDDETAQIAIRAALTGHLVMSSLHAGSCQGVLERLMLMCPDNYAVLSSLALVANQRLVRRLCQNCEGRGCGDCLESGYKDRVPLLEWAKLDDDVRSRIRKSGPAELKTSVSMQDFARTLVAEGITDQAEIERAIGS